MSDLDVVLRHVAQGMPEDFARGVLGPGVPLEVVGWQDTVVAARERRMDRVLSVRVEHRPRWLHAEWAWEWTKDLPYRVYDYQSMIALAQRDSTLARQSLLWLVFAPLVIDVSEVTLRAAVEAARERSRSEDELVEVAAAMRVVADYTPEGPRLREVLMSVMGEGVLKRSSLFRKGLVEGEKLGRADGLGPLRHLFERRLGRSLTTAEADTLHLRLHTIGPVRLGDVVLDLTPTDLPAWLGDADAQ